MGPTFFAPWSLRLQASRSCSVSRRSGVEDTNASPYIFSFFSHSFSDVDTWHYVQSRIWIRICVRNPEVRNPSPFSPWHCDVYSSIKGSPSIWAINLSVFRVCTFHSDHEPTTTFRGSVVLRGVVATARWHCTLHVGWIKQVGAARSETQSWRTSAHVKWRHSGAECFSTRQAPPSETLG